MTNRSWASARNVAACTVAMLMAVPALAEDDFVLATSKVRNLQVLADGGAAWCKPTVSLRMVLESGSPDLNNSASQIEIMNRLRMPITTECKTATAAELTVIEQGRSTGTYRATADKGWLFSSAPVIAQQAVVPRPAPAPAVAPSTPPLAVSPSTPPLDVVDYAVKLRIEQQELRFLLETKQIDQQEFNKRDQSHFQRDHEFRQRLASLPRDRQISLEQQINNRIAIVFPPIKEQWDAKVRSFQEQETAQAEKRTKELAVDAARAAELQASRTILQRRLQQGAISGDEARARDAASIAEITRLQNKYVAYGDQWAVRFNSQVQQLATQLVRTQDTKERIADTTSEVGKDAHRAGEIYLAIKRNELRRTIGAITGPASDSENSPLQRELNAIEAKYASGGPLAASRNDFQERFMQLGPRVAGQYAEQWSKEANAQVAASRAAANEAAAKQNQAQRQRVEEQRQKAVNQQWLSDTIYSVFINLKAIALPLAPLGLIFFVVYRLATAKKRRAAKEARIAKKHWEAREKQRGESNRAAQAKFGASKDERSRIIDEVFDKKSGDVEFYLDESGINCRFQRSISAMSPREREVLRTAYHVYNLELSGSETNFYNIRFGLIYGDGKATIVGSWKFQPSDSIKSITDALKRYQDGDTSESMINFALSGLQDAVKKNPGDPILSKLSSRLYGDGGDLVPGAPLKSGAKGEPIEAGLVLGLDEKTPGNWWYYDGEGSLITVAPPGCGKTQSQVFPNLLMWKGAAVILDVKGEIYEQTSKWRQENVGPVYKFSPLDPGSSHGYNPLALVRSDTEYLWEDARFLADMMIVPSGAKDPFWESRARDVLSAAIARICLEEDIGKRSMGDVIDILHGVGWDKFVTYMEARVDIRSMSRAGHSLASMDPKTRDGVLQSALASMSAWDGDRIARAMKKSDWSPLDLRGGTNPTIYICLKPNEIDSYISVLRVFIAQHIRALTSELPPRGAHPILFLLDELPRLRHMPPVEEALEIGRQYGIKLWMFAQSLGQLENAYPNAEGMVGSCAIRMFMNPSLHDETAQKISDDIGFQDSIVDGTRVKIVEPNILAGPQYKDMVIVMAANAKAARLKKYFTYQDETLKARLGMAEAVNPSPRNAAAQ